MTPDPLAELLRAMIGGAYLILTGVGTLYLMKAIWVVFRK